ncbi:MAG TPA: TIGR04053 family radical SAM/SPASM domain-containing protein [Acidimicrobiales bacterium]|nr:TIGR04053 family radical SAM/SPASM domain-containing protein [Acidimicrobiales bacterium]
MVDRGGGAAGVTAHPSGSRVDRRRFDDRPLLVFWETTKACDLVCVHCRASAQRTPGPGELSNPEARALVDELASIGSPRPILVLTGGDCLKRPDLLDVAAHAQLRRVPLAIAPSVSPLLDDATLAALHARGVRTASLSLDGASARAHEQVRGIPGHFVATLAAIGTLRRNGFKVQVNTTVMASNLEELADVAVRCHDAGVDVWEVFFLVATGRGTDVEATSAVQNEDVCHFLVDASRYGFTVRTVEAPFFRRVAAERRAQDARVGDRNPAGTGPLYARLRARLEQALGPPALPVRAPSAATRDGKGVVFVAADGGVHPSGFLPVRVGDVRDGGLVAAYRGAPLLRSIRGGAFDGPCGRCAYTDLCGGSRARAFAASGDPLGSDPGCVRVAASLDASPSPTHAGPRPARRLRGRP